MFLKCFLNLKTNSDSSNRDKTNIDARRRMFMFCQTYNGCHCYFLSCSIKNVLVKTFFFKLIFETQPAHVS